MVAKKVISSVGRTGRRFFRGIFKLRIFLIFMAFILINSVIIGVQEGSLEVVIKDLGARFLTPTVELGELGVEVVERGSLYQRSTDVWGGFWDFFLDLGGILSQLYVTIMWIYLLAFLIAHSPLSNDSQKFVNYSLGFIFFFIFQMLYTGFVMNDIFLPLRSLKDFGSSIPYIVRPFAELGDKFVSDKENITEMSSSLNNSLDSVV